MPLFGSPAWHLGALPARLVGSYGGAGGFAGTVANLTATGGAQQIALDWDDTPGATRYAVQRSADGLAGWATLDDAVATSDYTDTGLADATTYYYRVRAGDASSWGPWSGVVSDATDAPFSPSDIAGLVLWLDASEGTYQSEGGAPALADGDPVGEWQDQSGSGNHVTQATGAAKPTLKTGASGLNGLPVLRFDGSSDWLSSPLALGTSVTLFAVLKTTGGSGTVYSERSTGGTNPIKFQLDLPSAALRVVARDDAGNIANATSPGTYASTWLVATAKRGGDTVTAYKGGSQVGTATSTLGATTTDAASVGCERSGGTANIPLAGDLAALLIYDSALSAGNLALLNTYLTDRYGL